MEGTVLVKKEEFAKLKVVVDFLAQYKDKVLDTYSFSDMEFMDMRRNLHLSVLYDRNLFFAVEYMGDGSSCMARCRIRFTDEQDQVSMHMSNSRDLSGLASLDKDANISISDYLKMKGLLKIDLDWFKSLPWSSETLEDIKERKQKELANELKKHGESKGNISKSRPEPATSLHSNDISIGIGALIICIISAIAAIIWFSVF